MSGTDRKQTFNEACADFNRARRELGEALAVLFRVRQVIDVLTRGLVWIKRGLGI